MNGEKFLMSHQKISHSSFHNIHHPVKNISSLFEDQFSTNDSRSSQVTFLFTIQNKQFPLPQVQKVRMMFDWWRQRAVAMEEQFDLQ